MIRRSIAPYPGRHQPWAPEIEDLYLIIQFLHQALLWFVVVRVGHAALLSELSARESPQPGPVWLR